MIKKKKNADIQQKWKRRFLTPLGKNTVIKSFIVIAKLNHLFIALPNPPQEKLSELKCILNPFVYGSAFKVKHSVMVKEYASGGLKILNIDVFINALKITWIRRLINFESKWTNFAKMYIDSNLLPFCGNNCSNKFWAETFKSFSKLIEVLPVKGGHIAEYPVFYNSEIFVGSNGYFL